MNGIIIYQSKYGSTKQYAHWLKEETGFEAYDLIHSPLEAISNADLVILGCSIFADKPKMATWINENWDYFQDKKLILYTTSGSPPTSERIHQGFKDSFADDIRDSIKYFPLGGKYVYKDLTLLDKLIMKLGIMAEKDPDEKERMKLDSDNVIKENITLLVNYLKEAKEAA